MDDTKVSLNDLIEYINTFVKVNNELSDNDSNDFVQTNKVTDSSKFDSSKFECLRFGESKNINDLPEKLKKIFDPFIKEFFRHGTQRTIGGNSEENISLYFSVLYCVIPEFKTFNQQQQAAYVTKLRDKLLIYSSDDIVFTKHNYDQLGWVKKDVMKMITQYKSNKVIIKLMADYFNINIFMLNATDDKLYVVSTNDSLDMFRPSIFLTFYDDVFEMIGYQNNFMINNDTEPIKKLINVDRKIILPVTGSLKTLNNSPFSIKFDDLDKYIPKKDISEEQKPEITITTITTITTNDINEKKETQDETNNEYGEIEPTDTDKEIFNDITQKPTKLVFKITSKTKLDEIQEIAKKLGISLDKDDVKTGKKKSKTKNDLVTEIDTINNK